MATFAPSSARRFAMAAPMPRDPPVTSAIFPSSFLVIVFLLLLESLSLVAVIDCLVGCGGAPLATYFVKLAPMPCGHRRRNGATTSSIFCCDCGSRKYDGGRRAKAAHLTAIAEPTDP